MKKPSERMLYASKNQKGKEWPVETIVNEIAKILDQQEERIAALELKSLQPLAGIQNECTCSMCKSYM